MFGNYATYWMRSTKRVWPVLVVGLVLLVLAVFSATHRPLQRWMYNATDSIPKGLYVLHYDTHSRPLRVGDIAVFAIPRGVLDIVIERRYIDPVFSLMKPIAAVAGDHVCTVQREVIVNRDSYGRIRPADSHGRPLPYFRTCGRVADDVIYTFTDDERSFDSRHYGPIKREDVIARATPLWTS